LLTDRQTNKQSGKNITSLDEVTIILAAVVRHKANAGVIYAN